MLERIRAKAYTHQIGGSHHRFDVGEDILMLKMAIRKQLASLAFSHTARKWN